jgi:hypothetical protein
MKTGPGSVAGGLIALFNIRSISHRNHKTAGVPISSMARLGLFRFVRSVILLIEFHDHVFKPARSSQNNVNGYHRGGRQWHKIDDLKQHKTYYQFRFNAHQSYLPQSSLITSINLALKMAKLAAISYATHGQGEQLTVASITAGNGRLPYLRSVAL